MKTMKQLTSLAYGLSLAMFAGGATAHGLDEVGQPACLEANFMMADAMNAPFGVQGAGQVLEVNIVTGERGITVANPFTEGNATDEDGNPGPICPPSQECPGPFKPTGVLSGGLNGHAFITSAGQQSLTEFHRDGIPIRTLSYRPLLGNPTGTAGRGTLPRPLGTQMMPNGNLIQAICDANFFNASNSDPFGPGESAVDPTTGAARPDNSSWMYFPPVSQTAERSANSRLLVIDQETLQVIDEYSQPKDQDPRWTCMAGIAFTEEGMGVSMFHGAAIAMVDWKAGLSDTSRGVGSNSPGNFKLDRGSNRAEVTRWIDLRGSEENPVPADHPSRRDSLRAWGLDEDGTIYVTDRERSRDCLRGQAPGASPNDTGESACNPSVFRQKVQVVDLGENYPSRTIGLDPGVNIIAGIRPNRMSATACDNIGGPGAIIDENGKAVACDVETLLIAASAYNPGCARTSYNEDGTPARGNQCFIEGGGVGEYSILPADADGNPDEDGNATTVCSGDPAGDNSGCAQPIATFLGVDNNDIVDPRMLMVIHEAFVQ